MKKNILRHVLFLRVSSFTRTSPPPVFCQEASFVVVVVVTLSTDLASVACHFFLVPISSPSTTTTTTSATLSPAYPFSVKSNVMWRPRGLSRRTNVSAVTSHGISGHNRAHYHEWRYTVCPSPLSPRLPLSPLYRSFSSPYFGLSFSRSRVRVLARANGETRVSPSPEVSKGWREERLFTYFHSRDLVCA